MKILIYDLETDSVDPKVAHPQLMGFKSSEVEGFLWTSNIRDMVSIIDGHDVIVGWNNRDYDNVIMTRFGANFRNKTVVDLMNIIHGSGFGSDKGRKSIIMTPDGKLLNTEVHTKKMADTTKALGGPLKIGDFDYNLFKQPFSSLTETQQKLALEYLEADINATEYIYKYVEDFFQDFATGGIEIDGMFKKFLTGRQVERKLYLTSSVASLVYKVICNVCNIPEKYSNAPSEPYGGGFVADPSQETCEGDIYCLDYSSLYPHIMIQANLYGRIGMNKTPLQPFDPKFVSQTVGEYDDTKLAPVGKALKEFYNKRLEYKRCGDSKQYTIKIIINTVYGLLGNPAFASVCDFVAAADCTALGRSWINKARQTFEAKGYKLLYTDTDSVYLQDPFNDKERLLKVRDEHIQLIKDSVPFPQDTFDMTVDAEIRFIAFFPSGSGKFLKKNYIYTQKNGKLVIVGHPIIKSTATPLGKLIFDRFIKIEILNNNRHKFSRKQIADWILHELENDLTLASVFYKVKPHSEYKNGSQIQCQIAKKYGEGSYKMIKLKREYIDGVGSNGNYIRVEDAGDLSIGMIDLTKTWSELGYFIETEQKTLGDFWK